MRQTSLDAYHEITENGLLSKRRLPLTANETFQKMYSGNTGPHNAASNSAARFSELRATGAIYEMGEKICSVTGKNVILWAITGDLPKKLPRKTSTSQKIAKASRLLAEMMQYIDTLPQTSNFVSEWNSKATEFQRSL
jgi:hypothetical protein